ncbi:MAG: rhodanese-like domain-containing protein [Candidatus Aminicenantes bacterium]|jgi:rhodanese-related sulfurtransferase
MRIKDLIFQIGIILCLSFVIGVTSNLALIEEYRKGDFSQSFLSQEEFPAIQFIGIFEAEELFIGGNAVFLDSRAEEKYSEGHIQGAVNIPFEDGEHIVDDRLAFPHVTTLVVYCDGNECQSSVLLAKVLAKFGFDDIRIFFGGWAEWLAAGLPMSEGNDP